MSKKAQQSATSEELSEHQMIAIAGLVAGRRQVEIATQLGITESTISRWRAEPPFIAALNLAVRESFDAVVGETRQAATEALRTVVDLMKTATDEKTRLSAALQLLRLHSAYDAGAPSLPTSAASIAHEQRQARTTREIEALTLSFGFGADG